MTDVHQIRLGAREYRVYLERGSNPPRGRVASVGTYYGKVTERDLTSDTEVKRQLLAKAAKREAA